MSKFEREQVFHMPKVLIAGYGIVGKSIHKDFPFAELYDTDMDVFKANRDKLIYNFNPSVVGRKYDICFICVPTPNDENNKCDIYYVADVINDVDADVYVIKSTVPPTTTDKFIKDYNKNIIFSPEFCSNTNFGSENNFVILGGDDYSCHKVRQLYELNKKSDFTIYQCSSVEAEIIKYMENCFLATKVIFCNQFKDIADLYGVDYSKIRDGLVLDERIGKSHTFVFDNYRGYDSKCLNKDIPSFINTLKEKGFNNKFLLETVDEINQTYRNKDEYDF